MLGQALEDDKDDPPAGSTEFPPSAGYTYLGQFIDHDITFDLTSLKDAQPVASKTPNFRTPLLDLDHVYGGGPNLSPFLYQNKRENRQAERFLIGTTKKSPLAQSTSDNDVPRNPEGVALTADPRQGENLILGQLHVVFLKLHNWLLDNPDALSLSPHYAAAGTPFAQAQRVLRWHYQWIVLHDFLKQVLDRTVFSALMEEEKAGPSDSAEEFRIPLEFSVAAFRFGHSMVRNGYVLNAHHSHVELSQLLKLTGRDGIVSREMPAQLPEEWKIEWRFFFEVDAMGSARHSGAFDTRISRGLFDVPIKVQKLFSVPVPIPHEELRLPIRTLLRGARVALPSGQRVAGRLGYEVLSGDRMKQGSRPEEARVLEKYHFLDDTPLWFYILKEAEILGKGCRLGPTGSKLIADVLLESLRSTPDSYLSAGGNWIPTLPVALPKDDQRAFAITDLILIVA